MKKINTWIDKNIIKIILIFFMIQPLLDVMTSLFLNVFKLQVTIGMIVRVLFLIFLIYYFIFIDKFEKKKESLVYFIILFFYCISFGILTILTKSMNVLFYEMQNMIRTFYFPVILVLLYRIIKNKKQPIEKKNYIKVMAIYLLLILIPNITNTALASYPDSKVGSLGWFNSANEISAILSLLFPYVFSWLFLDKTSKNNKILKIIYFIIVLYAFFSMGTKMTIITLAFVAGIYLLQTIIQLIQKKKYKILIGLSTGLLITMGSMILILPKTSFYKNLVIHLEYLGVNSVQEIITDPHVIDHFIFSSRLSFLNITNHNYMKSSLLEKSLGIGYIENYATDEVRIKQIEMDPFDIFYRQGLIGFILFFIPVIKITMAVLKKTFNNKIYIEDKYNNQNFYLSLAIIVFMSTVMGHVITAPAVSIFVSIIIVNQEVLLNKGGKTK